MKMIKKCFKRIFRLEERANTTSQSTLALEKFIPISETQDQDVFIAGFPKSGNTWMQNLISGVLFGISTEFLPDKLTQELVPDMHYKKHYKRFLDFTCFKTHDLPKKKYRRVIYLVRDPRDVMVSYFHFKKHLGLKSNIEEMVLSQDGELNQWKKHVNQWKLNPFNSEIIITRYEDLVNETSGEIKKIGDFLKVERSDEVLKNAVAGNSFKMMQKKEELLGLDNEKNDLIRKSGGKFFRKGKIGSYKEELSEDLINKISVIAQEEMKYFGYK